MFCVNIYGLGGLHFPLLLYYFNLYIVLIVVSQTKSLLLLSSKIEEVIIVVYNILYLIYTVPIYWSIHFTYNKSLICTMYLIVKFKITYILKNK